MKFLQTTFIFVFLLTAFLFSVSVLNAQTQVIDISVSKAKIERGQTVEISVKTQNKQKLSAQLLKPTVGIEELSLQKVGEGNYRGRVEVKADAPAGLYIVHAWTGDKENPKSVGKSSFRVGNIVADFFIANYLDKQKPAEDLDNYLKDFRSIGGNFLIAHNLIISSGAFYPSNIAKTDVKSGSENDIIELVLSRADKEGFSVLLSVSWDMTRNSPYKDRMKEIKSIITEMYSLYRHHPSLAGFYSYQEGSGTYYAPFVREFSEYVKSINKGFLTACAPHIDDPLLASYLSVIEELDIMIYQGAVMASYRTDNRKKYPVRRVHDFSALGAGAKRLQNKIVLTHVELFAYMEKRQSEDFVTASFEDIYRQILSAATVTDTDGISMFAYHAHIYEPLKKFKQVQKSRDAVAKGLKAYQLITSKVSQKQSPLALYIPYSDWIVERWNNYLLPASDAFRSLGVSVDILPYAPPLEESIYPFYPFHHNKDVLERLLKEKTVLILTNVSGFQQTDSDLIKEFVIRGGVIVAFGGQIPMGRSYERKELFGGEELSEKQHTEIIVKDAIGKRIAKNKSFTFPATPLFSWTANTAQIIATFEDGSAAILVNSYGKGKIITILPDANFAARYLSELTRDAFDYALNNSGNNPLIDVIGANENFDSAMNFTKDSFSIALINHNNYELEISLRFPTKVSNCTLREIDLITKKIQPTQNDVKINIPKNQLRIMECKF